METRFLYFSDSSTDIVAWYASDGAANPTWTQVDKTTTLPNGAENIFFADIDDDPILAESHQIRSVPSILVEQDGQVVERMVGVQDPATLIAKFELYSPLPNEG